MYSFNHYDFYFLIKGMGITIILCLGIIILSILVAVPVSLIRSLRSKSKLYVIIKKFLALIVAAIRGIPLMLLLIFLFFGLPFMGVNFSPLVSAVFGLTIYSAAYLSEIVRTGIESIAKEQWEAAASLGFNYLQTMRKIILPQSLRIMLPPTASLFIGLIKDSSLVAVIGFVELARAGRIIVERTHQSLLVFSLVALLYFLICYPLSVYTKKMEKVIGAKE